MRATVLKTVNLPNVAAGNPPVIIARGTSVPVRALVRNVTGTLVFLATASQDLVGPGGAGASTFRLAPNQSDVFVLAPGQELFAAGNGVGALVSVASSEALPLV